MNLKQNQPAKVLALIALLIMGSYGIKFAREGVDVTTASPPDLVYSSKWTNFKIGQVLQGVLVIPAGSPDDVYSLVIANPLPYLSIFMPFVESTSNAPGKWQLASIGDAQGTVDLTTDTDSAMPNCVIDVSGSSGDFLCSVSALNVTSDRTYTFRIVVFLDDLQEDSFYNNPVTGDFGLKLSDPEIRVVTESSDSEISMSTKLNNLTIALSGTITAPAAGPGIEVTHGLGFVPITLVLVEDPNAPGRWMHLPALVQSNPNGFGVGHAHSYVDTSKLYFSPNTGFDFGAPTDIKYKYIIFNERVI